jgi:hypothetical protein
MRDGTGARLLGALGHADLSRFARSYTPRLGPVLVSPPGRVLGKLAARCFGRRVRVAIEFLELLRDLASARSSGYTNPMNFADRVAADRRVRFLVGQADPLVRPDDATTCAGRFGDGACHVVPGLDHGRSRFGPSYEEHVRTYIGTQLGDWRW